MNARAALLATAGACCAPAVAQTDMYSINGAAAGDHFGVVLVALGDVDADGADDWGAGAPESDAAGLDAGEVRIYSGRNQLLIRHWTGPSVHAHFGRSFASAGDLDGDGHGDVIVGAPQYHGLAYGDYGTGFVEARSGQTGAVLWTFAPAAGERVGWAVDGGGQIDGDGVPDVLVGDPDDDGCFGIVYALSGATGSVLYTVQGTRAQFGHAVAFLDDSNGDGRTEFAVGEPNACMGTLYDGLATVVDGLSGAALWTASGAPGFCGDEYGWSIASAGDFSGDGRADVLVGGRDANCFGGTNGGFGDVRDGVSGALLFRKQPTMAPFTGYGMGLAALNDLDGDGQRDVAIGGPGAEPYYFLDYNQAVLVCSGANAQTLLSLPPATNTDAWGYSLLSMDVTDDGLVDLVVGSPLSDVNGVDSGLVRIYTIVRSVVSYCESEQNSLGCTPAISGVGTPSATLAGAFDVRASNVLNNKSGLLFYGFKPRQTPFQGGHMCIVAPTKRTPIQSSGGSTSGNDCTGVFNLDFNARIQSGVDLLLVAGEEVCAQYWSRDPADPSTTNLTDALAFYIRP